MDDGQRHSPLKAPGIFAGGFERVRGAGYQMM